MKRLLKDIKIFFKKNDSIVQFSPPRTGSTLIYNVLKEIFNNKKILKHHDLSIFEKKINIPIVVSVRNPFDSIVSRIRIKNEEDKLDEELISKYIDYYVNEAGIKDVLEISEKKNVLILKYEDFKNNFNYIFDNLEIFFSIKIKTQLKQTIEKKYNIQNMKKIADSYNDFSSYDTTTGVHGKHISQYNGNSYYKDFLNQKYIDQIYNNIYIRIYEEIWI